MNKLSVVLIFCLLVNNNFSQTFRNGFDSRDAASNGNGASYYSNVSSKIHNDETVSLKGYINMFLATQDKKYLDQFIIHAKRVQERRDDNIMQIQYQLEDYFPAIIPVNPEASCYISFQFCTKPFASMSEINTSSKGWSYVDKPCDCIISDQAVVQSGEITYPMALFVRYMQIDPTFMALENEIVPLEAQTVLPSENCSTTSILTYKNFADWLECRIDETIDYHEAATDANHPQYGNDEWGWQEDPALDYGDGVTHSRYMSGNLNEQTSLGRTIALMYLITGDVWYHERATAIALLTHAHLTEDEEVRTMLVNGETKEFYSWRYGWNMNECVEDVGHAYLTMEFAEICHQNGITHVTDGYQLFTYTDMERFANTVAYRIYKNPNEAWENTFGGVQLICSTGGVWAYAFLAKYNPLIYEMMVGYDTYKALYGGAHLIAFSELAKLQSPIYMDGENFKFNPVAVRISPAVSGSNFFTTTGDFDGDEKLDYVTVDGSANESSIFKFYNPDNATNPNIGDQWFAAQSASLGVSDWKGLAAGDFDLSQAPADHIGDELLALHQNGDIYLLKQNGISVQSEILSSGISWAGLTSGDFLPNYTGDEGIALTTAGNIIFITYDVAGIEMVSPIISIGILNPVGITAGNFDLTDSRPQIAVLSDDGGIIILSYDHLTTSFVQIHQFNSFGTGSLWTSITSGNFDGDGIDEIVAHRDKDGQMFVLKVKTTGFEVIYSEYFHTDQGINSLATGKFNMTGENDQLLVLRNFDGQITFFNIEGNCPNLYLDDLSLDPAMSIDNAVAVPAVSNNYPLDYHVSNTLTTSNINVEANTTVNFAAGHRVVLKSGTSIKPGSTFHAYIDPTLSCGADQFLKMSTGGEPSNDLRPVSEKPEVEKPLPDFSADIYPNPADGNFTIQLKGVVENQTSNITVYNPFGELVYETSTSSVRTTINLTDQASGIYIIKIQNEGNVFVGKIVIQ